MEEAKKKYDIGVIVGRFQIHELHSAHKHLIEEVLSRHDKVIIFLGISMAIGTWRNPLDFTSRKLMIEEIYGDRLSGIFPITDMKFDDLWSKKLDERIREVFQTGSVILYGSRDSFLSHYIGNFDTCELEPESLVSASEIRRAVKNKALRCKEFRAGMIYAAGLPFPFNYTTIDVAIFNDEGKLLLARKPFEKEFRFVGGFSDIKDESFEATVKREAAEETGLEIDDIQYVCSRSIKDWRYRDETDRGIKTIFFKAKRIFGSAVPNDDIVEVRWVDVDKVDVKNLVPEHQHLFNALLKNLKK